MVMLVNPRVDAASDNAQQTGAPGLKPFSSYGDTPRYGPQKALAGGGAEQPKHERSDQILRQARSH